MRFSHDAAFILAVILEAFSKPQVNNRSLGMKKQKQKQGGSVLVILFQGFM